MKYTEINRAGQPLPAEKKTLESEVCTHVSCGNEALTKSHHTQQKFQNRIVVSTAVSFGYIYCCDIGALLHAFQSRISSSEFGFFSEQQQHGLMLDTGTNTEYCKVFCIFSLWNIASSN